MSDQNHLANVQRVREGFARAERKIAEVCPSFVDPKRIIRLAIAACARNPRLASCDLGSLLDACLISARVGLEPDGVLGMAHLVPFWNTKKKALVCTWIPGYQGLLELAFRSERVVNAWAHVVRDGDVFDYSLGGVPWIKHKPPLRDGSGNLIGRNERGKVIAAYACLEVRGARLPKFEVMLADELAEFEDAAREKCTNRKTGEFRPWASPWFSDDGRHKVEMQRKTVLRRVLKTAPRSVELMASLLADDGQDETVRTTLDLDAASVTVGPARSVEESTQTGASGEVVAAATEQVAALEDRAQGLAPSQTINATSEREPVPVAEARAEESEDARQAASGGRAPAEPAKPATKRGPGRPKAQKAKLPPWDGEGDPWVSVTPRSAKDCALCGDECPGGEELLERYEKGTGRVRIHKRCYQLKATARPADAPGAEAPPTDDAPSKPASGAEFGPFSGLLVEDYADLAEAGARVGASRNLLTRIWASEPTNTLRGGENEGILDELAKLGDVALKRPRGHLAVWRSIGDDGIAPASATGDDAIAFVLALDRILADGASS